MSDPQRISESWFEKRAVLGERLGELLVPSFALCSKSGSMKVAPVSPESQPPVSVACFVARRVGQQMITELSTLHPVDSNSAQLL